MIIKYNLSILFLLSFSVCLTAQETVKDLAGSRPNILLINADDMDAADIGCYGATHIATPVIDRLAASGIQFRTAYTPSMCGPSRALLLSGKYATRTGRWHNDGSFNTGNIDPEKEETFYNILHKAGYKTAVAGKWSWDVPAPNHFDESCIYPRTINRLPKGAKYDGYVKKDDKWKAGARFWHPMIIQNGKYLPTTENDYGPDIFSDFLVDFMERNKNSTQPLLMYYPMVLCHAEDARKDDKMGFPPTPDPNNPGKMIDNKYNGLKEYIDHIVGKLVKTLEETGLRENTIIIFTTDNGSYGKRGKGKTYEPGSWVPFIVNWPNVIPERGLVNEMVSHADILPTFAQLAGTDFESEIDGISFLPVLEGKTGKRDHLISYLGREAVVRDGRWLLERFNAPNNKMQFWDCGDITAGNSYEDPSLYYKNVTDSQDPEVIKAKKRLLKVMEGFKFPNDGLSNKKW